MFRTGSLVALFLAAPLASAQPSDPPQTVALIQVLLPYVGDKNFQAQLSLTPEQAKTLLAHRQKQWDEEYTTSPNRIARTGADRDAGTVAVFKSVLKPEQYKRATQLAAQDVWNTNWSGGPASTPTHDLTRAPVFVLTTYPEIATALKLSEDQQKLVSALSATGPDPRFGRGFRNASVYLAPSQTAAAKTFLGPINDTVMNPEYDTRGAGNPFYSRYSGGPLSSGDALIELTLAKDVRTDLGLTQAQQSELSNLSGGYGYGGGFGGGGGRGPRGGIRGGFRGGFQPGGDSAISPAAQQKVAEIIDAEMRATLTAILKPDQLTRLEQIYRRTNADLWSRMPSDVNLYFQTDVAAALKYTPEQDKQFDAAAAAYAAAVEKALRAGTDLESTEKAIKAAGANRDKAYAAVLTAAQSAKFKELVGEPFTGNTNPEQLGGGGLPNDFYRQYREASFGRYSGDLSTVGRNTGLATELKLTDEQVKKLRFAAFELSEQFGNERGGGLLGGGAMSEKASEFIAKSLTDILTPEQAKRFRQIMLQLRDFRQQPGGGFGGFNTTVASAVSYPGVAEEVKLTAEQKDKLLDGTDPAEVLTAEQKAAIKAMHGEPYKDLATLVGRGGGGMGGGGRPKGPGGPGVRTPVILELPWEPLTLSSDQMEKLAVAANRYAFATVPEPRPAGKGGGGFGGAAPVPPAKLTAAVEAFEKELAEILTAEQKAKLDPLALQQFAANSGLRLALTRDDVAKRVNLTPEQVKTMTAAEADLRKFAALVEAAGIDYEKQQALLVLLRDKLDDRIVALLTADQKAAWKELTGEPWPGFKKTGLTSVNRGFGGPGFGN